MICSDYHCGYCHYQKVPGSQRAKAGVLHSEGRVAVSDSQGSSKTLAFPMEISMEFLPKLQCSGSDSCLLGQAQTDIPQPFVR
jgi:hypothetical protein